MADTDRTETLTEQEADKLFDAVMSFTPDLGQADVESIESAMTTPHATPTHQVFRHSPGRRVDSRVSTDSRPTRI